MEEPIKDEKKILIEDKFIRLSAEEGKEFKLKKCLIDELGMNLFVGTKYKPKYRYFIKKDEKENKKNINLKKKIIPNRNKNSSNYLTPIPIYRNNFNTENKFEKDELNNAERTAVLIRRYEYYVNVRRNNSQEYKEGA